VRHEHPLTGHSETIIDREANYLRVMRAVRENENAVVAWL